MVDNFCIKWKNSWIKSLFKYRVFFVLCSYMFLVEYNDGLRLLSNCSGRLCRFPLELEAYGFSLCCRLNFRFCSSNYSHICSIFISFFALQEWHIYFVWSLEHCNLSPFDQFLYRFASPQYGVDYRLIWYPFYCVFNFRKLGMGFSVENHYNKCRDYTLNWNLLK